MRTLFLILGFFLVAVSSANAQNSSQSRPDWTLVPANSVASDRHLVITVERRSKKYLKNFTKLVQRKYGVKLVAEWPLSSISVHCLVLKVPRGSSLVKVMEQMGEDRSIRSVQAMKQFKTLGLPSYKDDLFQLQTNLATLNVVQAHQKVTGRNVKVAIIDTGIDLSHPDLANRNFKNKDFVGVGTIGHPKEKHGTAIAGVIAASNTNRAGIVGVAPNVEMIGMRGCWQDRFRSSGRCSTFSLARALNFAIEKKVDVINLSLGGPYDPLLSEIIDKAVKKHGIVVVAAYGDNKNARFPAVKTGVIGVSGKKVSKKSIVSAPGIDILSTSLRGGYDYFSGSSVATAHVSAVAALMIEANSKLTPNNIFKIIKKSTDKSNKNESLNACKIISKIKSISCL